MEDFPSQPETPQSYLDATIPDCDLLVSLVGICYGSSPTPPSGTSFTELEYDRAKSTKVDVLAFLLPDDFPLPANLRESDESFRKQQAFRRKVGQDVLLEARFSNPDELAWRVVAAIRNWETSGRRRTGASDPEPVDCLILAGGSSRDLWPLTSEIPKVTLPVANKPVLHHVLDFVGRSPFVKNVLISVNADDEKQISECAAGNRGARSIQVIPQPGLQDGDRLGPIGAIDHAISSTQPRDLLVVGGDNLFGFELESLLRLAAERDNSVNAMFDVTPQPDARQYGIATLGPGGVITEFQEKLDVVSSTYVSTACYLLRRTDVELVHEFLTDGVDSDSLGNFVRWLVIRGRPPVGYKFDTFWFDIGTRQKLLAANRHFLSKHSRSAALGEGSVEPVLIDRTARVENSQIGPNVSVGPKARISNSEVSNSIILEGAYVHDSRLTDSIVGPGSTVQGRVSNFICGPRSNVFHETHEM